MKTSVCTLSASGKESRIGLLELSGAKWVGFGESVFLFADNKQWPKVARISRGEGMALRRAARVAPGEELYLVVQKGRRFQQSHSEVPVLLDKGRYLVVSLASASAKRLCEERSSDFNLKPLPVNQAVFDLRLPSAERRAPPDWIRSVVDRITRSGFESAVRQLVTYRTRYSTSSHYSSAAMWAKSVLEHLGYHVSAQPIRVGSIASQNVVAEKAGIGSGPRGLVLAVAHLDSINAMGGPDALAPGADDNASGSAGLLEIARALTEHTGEHDLRLVLLGGEEQGLLGSIQYVAALSADDKERIRAVVNMDMIGVKNTGVPIVLLEGAALSQAMINSLATAAHECTSLTVQTSLHAAASDHVPFIQAGIPAVLTIEGADGANGQVHSADDTIERLDWDLALDILRMNTAFITQTLGELSMPKKDIPSVGTANSTAVNPEDWPQHFKFQFSGRYQINGGVPERGRAYGSPEIPTLHNLTEPIPSEQPAPGRADSVELTKLRCTLHIDIDGIHPLNVVSGTLSQTRHVAAFKNLAHFIGQVTSNTGKSHGGRDLKVRNFNLIWPASGEAVTSALIRLRGSFFETPKADVTFITAGGKKLKPFTAERASAHFREIEVEVDQEDHAAVPEPYDTFTHPDRPANLAQENLTLEKAFAKSGIKITRSNRVTTINTSSAGGNSTWSYKELHDAMVANWSRFANKPQWKMWIFLAEKADDPALGGVMFDGDINEPGGVDRQGTAIFTQCEHFHLATGAYPKANPPAAEAARRELFFDLIHETGHAFNLAHSFQKTLGAPWAAPAWLPVVSDDQALSWMNYPDMASPGNGDSAKWFYDRFEFRFDDRENLFLRHAPARFIQMGNEAWYENHGRVARNTLDPRLSLAVRTRKPIFELGEAISVELRLKNISNSEIMLLSTLDPCDGFVELAVTQPRGERRPFMPILHTRRQISGKILKPGEALYWYVRMSVGAYGSPFKEPGAYRIEASFANPGGGTAAAIMQVYVRPPVSFDDFPVVNELFNARVGSVLYVNGTRGMKDVIDKLDWVLDKLDRKHPARYRLKFALARPYAEPFKQLDIDTEKLKLAQPDPERVEKCLKPIVTDVEPAADSLGHIEYGRSVELYTQCAEMVKKRTDARAAQSRLVELFKQRKVLPEVIQTAEARLKQLK